MLQRKHAYGSTTLTPGQAERGNALAHALAAALIEAVDAVRADTAALVRSAAEPKRRECVAAYRQRTAGRG